MENNKNVDEIDQIRLIIQESENTGNLALMSSIMADDITVIVPNTPVVYGKPAGEAFLKSWFDAFIIEIEYIPEKIQISQDLAYEWCTYYQTTTDKSSGEKASEIGRIMWIFKKVNNQWLQSFAIWNTIDPS
ncbi:nuclear transport factor 2 family protein [Arcicella aquatica]|uniref:Nuclear transport factor 2 family protein n=1 Tax=Arcicella aquatica TaxID=217141 RepID=A0ABU5QPU2_9BACT|nr:nuclear transport factor 2 family protein [Arcicella aquatica]MEA5259095.1 nuclear transport factor 2 family protein [Arcicella aquatica]